MLFKGLTEVGRKCYTLPMDKYFAVEEVMCVAVYFELR